MHLVIPFQVQELELAIQIEEEVTIQDIQTTPEAQEYLGLAEIQLILEFLGLADKAHLASANLRLHHQGLTQDLQVLTNHQILVRGV